MDHWKIKHGIKLKNENVKIRGLISTCVEYFKFAAREKNVSIKTDFKEDYEVYADPARIVQVVNNLLANAIKFSPEKGVVTLSVSDDQDDRKTSKLNIKVTDEGAGFDEVEIKSVLSEEPTTEGGRVGEGIGLPISRQIIELHNGKMWVENGKEKGAVFNISIPHIIRSTERVNKKTHSILLVDDVETIRKSTKETFEKLGFEVTEASNGKEALEMIDKANPDLILTDLDMPVMNGVSLMQAVKNNDLTKNIPIIVFTAKSKQTELDNYYRLAQDFIFKPGTLSEFANKTKEVLHLSADFDLDGSDVDPKRKSVLVVDDEEDIRELIVDSIDALKKYNVISAKNGIEALFMFKKYKIDLVLSDMTMPIMNGIEFAHYVKEMSKTPVVFVTAQTREIERKKGQILDVNEVISKPFKTSDIKTVVGKYLE
jgi:CheY-like chemotaxis protein